MKREADKATVLVIARPRLAPPTSIYRGARFQRCRDEKVEGLPFTVIAKLDLVALFLEAAGLEATGPKKGTR